MTEDQIIQGAFTAVAIAAKDLGWNLIVSHDEEGNVVFLAATHPAHVDMLMNTLPENWGSANAAVDFDEDDDEDE